MTSKPTPEGWGLTREQIRDWADRRGDDAGRLSRFVLRLLADCARLRAELDEAREREGAVCPEDVPFDEYIRALTKRVEQAERERDEARADAERERMRLAGCSVAALGYYKRGDAIAPEYGSGSLDDVIALRERAEAAEADAAWWATFWRGLRPHVFTDRSLLNSWWTAAMVADADERAAALAADGAGKGKVKPS